MPKKHKMLECLGDTVGKEVFLELRGSTPLIRSRREIALKGTVVSVDEFSGGPKTITLKIPLEHLATLCEVPITRAQRRSEEKARGG